jgi:hypothetical protein
LRWLPDETVFSLASRYHRMSAQVRASRTCQVLFGRPRGGLAHDLPDCIDSFIERTHGALGRSAEEVIRQHTILPFYLPFRSPGDATSAFAALRGPGIGSLKFRLGMLTSRFRAHHPLKACPRCLKQDVNETCVAYWHLAHQYPGVWFCMEHGEVLLESTMKSTGVGRFHWHLPDAASMVRTIARLNASADEEALDSLLRGFAAASQSLATLPGGFHFDPKCLVRVHRARLIEAGLAGPTGRLVPGVGSSLSVFMSTLRSVPELSALALRSDQIDSQFAYLRDPARVLTHPLRHIAHALWLYGSWGEFLEAYERQAALASQEPKEPVASRSSISSPQDPRVRALLDLVRKQGFAVTRAANAVGVDVKTGMAWAAQAGMSCEHRPKKLLPELREKLVYALRRGADKANAALLLDISVETVTNVLRTEVGLHEVWMRARAESKRSGERRTWLRLIRGSPDAGMTSLRWMAPATYAWLYRNDRAWLVERSKHVPTARLGNNSSLNWGERDRELSNALLKAGADMVAEAPERRITLSRLYQRVPDVKPKLRYLHRLPLTRAAIEQAMQHRPSPKGSRALT